MVMDICPEQKHVIITMYHSICHCFSFNKLLWLAKQKQLSQFRSKRHEAANEDAEENGHDVSWLPFLSSGGVDAAVVALESERKTTGRPIELSSCGKWWRTFMDFHGFSWVLPNRSCRFPMSSGNENRWEHTQQKSALAPGNEESCRTKRPGHSRRKRSSWCSPFPSRSWSHCGHRLWLGWGTADGLGFRGTHAGHWSRCIWLCFFWTSSRKI